MVPNLLIMKGCAYDKGIIEGYLTGSRKMFLDLKREFVLHFLLLIYNINPSRNFPSVIP